MGKKVIFIVIVGVVAIAFLFLFQKKTNLTQPSATSLTSQSALAGYSTLTGVTWSAPQQASEQIVYGSITGEKITSELTGETTTVMNFENKQALSDAGFTLDINLAADGPGSSVWGYSKTENGQTQAIIFSYTTQPSSSNPNEPLQFNCPCRITVSIFESTPFTQYKNN